jgi:predicted nucleic acid-binding protein
MSDRFFLDTNIFVYSVEGARSAKRERATELIAAGLRSGKGTISYQVIQEFFNVAFRRLNPRMTFAEAEQQLAWTFSPMLTVHSSPLLFGEALVLSRRYSLSWYDSLIVAAAVESKCGILYSEDLQDGQSFGDLKIVNPFKVR